MNQKTRIELVADIICYSPIVVKEGMRPQRVVIRSQGGPDVGKYIVHDEYFTVHVNDNEVYYAHFAFEQGAYRLYNNAKEGEKQHYSSDKEYQYRAARLVGIEALILPR